MALISSCQEKKNDSEKYVTENKDTISSTLKNDSLNQAIRKVARDTILPDTINLGNTQINDTITNFDHEVVISEKWLEAISRFKKDSLPDTLSVYLKPVIFIKKLHEKSPSVDYMDTMEGNIDEDMENEKVIFLKYSGGSSDLLHTLVLNHQDGKWLLVASIKYRSRYTFDEVIPEIISKYEMLICKSGSWGSAHNGNYFHFYKKVNGCLKNVLNVTKTQFFGGYIGNTLNGQYQIISNDQIIIKYYYSYFYITEKVKADGSFETLDIIKDKETDIITRWNEKNHVFGAVNPKQTKLLEGYAFDFQDTTDINYLKKYGSPIQKKGLTEIDKRFPKNSK